jgi:RNA polymerase sigma factor (sigma-70 family)
MAADLPPELAALLVASDPGAREAAWTAFVARHSSLLLTVAATVAKNYDARMDGYAHVLEQLREAEFRRLRAYVPDGSTRFTTWLAVVARRLCFDEYRRRYGRDSGAADASASAHVRTIRRRLADSEGSAEALDALESTDTADPSEGLAHARALGLLDAVLHRLAPEDRLLLKLRFEDGLSARQIAQVTGMPTAFHVYRRVRRLLGLLRRDLGREGLRDLEA